MSRIVFKTEAANLGKANSFTYFEEDFPSAICQSAAYAARHLNAKAIACFTETGGTARTLAKFRPPVPIIAFTPDESVVTQLQLTWGACGVLAPPARNTDEQIRRADAELQRLGLASQGDKVVIILGAPTSLCGSTNLMKLHRIGEKNT